MQILTKEIKKKLVSNHEAQDGTKKFKAVVKLFNPTGVGRVKRNEISFIFLHASETSKEGE